MRKRVKVLEKAEAEAILKKGSEMERTEIPSILAKTYSVHELTLAVSGKAGHGNVLELEDAVEDRKVLSANVAELCIMFIASAHVLADKKEVLAEDVVVALAATTKVFADLPSRALITGEVLDAMRGR